MTTCKWCDCDIADEDQECRARDGDLCEGSRHSSRFARGLLPEPCKRCGRRIPAPGLHTCSPPDEDAAAANGRGEVAVAFDIHVFTGKTGALKASITLANGQRTKPRQLSKRAETVLMELLQEHRTYTEIKAAKK